jgi:lipoprotein-releasing system ATP-binding protein
MSALVHAENLTKGYPSGSGRVEVLRGSTLSVSEGERVAIIGASGVGKSTLLHLLAGLDRPDAGSLQFKGEDLLAMSERGLADYRNRHVGMVFQFYHLLPELTAHENVMLPMLIAGEHAEAVERASTLLSETGLAERAGHFPSQMSGGERQRVALARALACRPSLLLADEPTGNLDYRNGLRVMRVIDDLHERHRTATVMVTHNPELVGSFDRVLEMAPGGVLQPFGTNEENGDDHE